MDKKPNKMTFKVLEGETISDCLARMDEKGYKPKKRMEKPIFKEVENGVEPAGSEIIFEGILKN